MTQAFRFGRLINQARKDGDLETAAKFEALEERAAQYVDRDVLCRMTMTMSLLLEHEPDLITEAENLELYACPHCGCTSADPFDVVENDEGEDVYECPDEVCGKHSEEEPELVPQEVYEWYAVTPWLAGRLSAMEQVILHDDRLDTPVWGRCTTGQAMIMDGVFQEIALQVSSDREELAKRINAWKAA